VEHIPDGDGGSSDGMLESAANHKNCATVGIGCGADAHGVATMSPAMAQPRTLAPLASHGWLMQVSFIPD
jgi:hypothetical protein